jgi:hypothetical protein
MAKINRWLRRARGVIGMGATWAVAWALFGIGVGVTSLLTPFLPWDAFFRVYDAPLPTLAIPGFIGGCLFSVVVMVAERHRRVEELSMARVAGWGGLGGFLVSLLPAALVNGDLGTAAVGVGILPLTAMIAVPLTLVSAGSAALSLKLARRATAADKLLEEPRSNSVRNLL